MAEVSGRALLGLVKFIKEQGGTAVLRDILNEAAPEARKVFDKSILVLSWYPYSVYVYLLRAIDRRMGSGDLSWCWKLGENAASLDIRSFLRTYDQKGGQKDLIQSCTMVWSSYYKNAGRMEATSAEPENTVLRITDFPEMDPAHCRLMEGWMNEVIKLIGTKVINKVTEVNCMSQGGPYHEFKCSWVPLNK